VNLRVEKDHPGRFRGRRRRASAARGGNVGQVGCVTIPQNDSLIHGHGVEKKNTHIHRKRSQVVCFTCVTSDRNLGRQKTSPSQKRNGVSLDKKTSFTPCIFTYEDLGVICETLKKKKQRFT
jgi:hypothetical protein